MPPLQGARDQARETANRAGHGSCLQHKFCLAVSYCSEEIKKKPLCQGHQTVVASRQSETLNGLSFISNRQRRKEGTSILNVSFISPLSVTAGSFSQQLLELHSQLSSSKSTHIQSNLNTLSKLEHNCPDEMHNCSQLLGSRISI